MVRSNVEIIDKNIRSDLEIKGSANEIILELSLILIRIKSKDNNLYRDILKSMNIISDSINGGIDVGNLEDMFVATYLEALKKGGIL